MSSSAPIVQLERLMVKYGERTVLHDISGVFAAGEIRVILGTSGCGKSTLLKTIIGLLRPAAGKVLLFGSELGDADSPLTQKVLKNIGVVFQNGALLGSLTVAENVALPLQMHTKLPGKLIEEIVRGKLAAVDLPHAAHLYPGELSGGMRKRAAMARALALDPPLLLCDEPSAGLDPVTSAGLDELLLRLRDTLGITIVVVTHELSSIDAIADSIIFLSQGRVLFDGRLDEAKSQMSGPVHDFFARREAHSAQAQLNPVIFTVENSL
jgi:phospholipid/cholesterol/gamma-HCH transport system ATP-binding protein